MGGAVIMEMFAVIPTRNRPTELRDLTRQLVRQGCYNLLVINNGDHLPPQLHSALHKGSQVYPSGRAYSSVIEHDSDPAPHIYEQWNRGLDWANGTSFGQGQRDGHAVAILNDDVVLPPNFVRRMLDTLEHHGPTIAFPNQHGHQVDLHQRHAGPTDLSHRISGYAFVVNGAHGIRCDEDFKWWFGDDDLDWRARSDYAGTYQVQDVTVEHLYPNESTNSDPARLAQADRDRETFVHKHGRRPW